MYGKCGDKHHNYGKRIRATEGKNNKNWKGGRILHTNGYIMVRDYNIRSGRSGDYKFEHRLVMEKSLGRKMLHNERIHHINRIKNDNRIENLMLFESPKKHVQYEHGAYNFLIHKNLISEYTKWFNKTKERIK